MKKITQSKRKISSIKILLGLCINIKVHQQTTMTKHTFLSFI